MLDATYSFIYYVLTAPSGVVFFASFLDARNSLFEN